MMADDIDDMITDLRDIPEEIRPELTPMFKQRGESVAATARVQAGWSTRIPDAIRVSVRYGLQRPGVLLRVSARRAPHARPYEGMGRIAMFRHPVHGDEETWVSQVTRPFLWPAVVVHRDRVAADIDEIVVDAARRHGFH